MGRRTLGHPKFFVQADGEPQFSAPGWSLGWNALSLRLQSNTFPRLFTGFDGWYLGAAKCKAELVDGLFFLQHQGFSFTGLKDPPTAWDRCCFHSQVIH